jgi:hypothetical protein
MIGGMDGAMAWINEIRMRGACDTIAEKASKLTTAVDAAAREGRNNLNR